MGKLTRKFHGVWAFVIQLILRVSRDKARRETSCVGWTIISWHLWDPSSPWAAVLREKKFFWGRDCRDHTHTHTHTHVTQPRVEGLRVSRRKGGQSQDKHTGSEVTVFGQFVLGG